MTIKYLLDAASTWKHYYNVLSELSCKNVELDECYLNISDDREVFIRTYDTDRCEYVSAEIYVFPSRRTAKRFVQYAWTWKEDGQIECLKYLEHINSAIRYFLWKEVNQNEESRSDVC